MGASKVKLKMHRNVVTSSCLICPLRYRGGKGLKGAAGPVHREGRLTQECLAIDTRDEGQHVVTDS